ncbi:trypsin-like peptidase domain-containing protein [Streptomyces sp. NPDC052114]|uniref:VMAP-C domain-containing protein n=1 Tax=unclassified Streptomyces TaxID=2593676 RepID=UPI00341255B2
MAAADEILRDLVYDATVWIHGARTPGARTPGAGDPGARDPGGGTSHDLWGSGFFVAPGKVLTCAHIFQRGNRWAGGTECGVSYRAGGRLRTAAARLRHCLPAAGERPRSPGASWPLPDLAVLELTEPVDHSCAWLSDLSSRPNGASGRLLLQGFVPDGDGEVESWTGECTVAGVVGDLAFRLGGEAGQIEQGVSGGPVVDLEKGAVIGVIKAQRNRADGGKAVQLTALRRLSGDGRGADGPGPDPYQELVADHDRWHWESQRPHEDAGPTWADVQTELAPPHRLWLPTDRARALAMLAELPHAPDVGTVERLVAETCADQLPPRAAPPRSWRDGAGLLYDPPAKDELGVFLSYLLRVARSVHAERPRAAEELQAWAVERGHALRPVWRRELSRLATVPVVVRATRPPAASEATSPAASEATSPAVSEALSPAAPVATPPAGPAAAPAQAPTAVPATEPALVPVTEPAPVPATDLAPVPATEPTPLPATDPAPVPTADPAPTPAPAAQPAAPERPARVPQPAARVPEPAAPTRTAAAPAPPPEPDIEVFEVGERGAAVLELRADWWAERRYAWSVRLVDQAGGVEVTALAEGAGALDVRALAEPPERLARALAGAFLRADAGSHVAPLHVLLPQELFDLRVDRWPSGGPRDRGTPVPLGEVRSVIVVDQAYVDRLASGEERPAPYRATWRGTPGAEQPTAVPLGEFGRRTPPGAVLIHCGPVAAGHAARLLRTALDAGATTVLWRRSAGTPEEGAAFENAARDWVESSGVLARLPHQVVQLRARARAGDPAARWAKDVALLHHDSGERLSGVLDLLSTP